MTFTLFLLIRKVRLKIKELHELHVIAHNVYTTTGDHPYLLLQTFWLKYFRGWIGFRFEVVSSQKLPVKLYFDYGEGFTEADTLNLTQTSLHTYQAEFVLISSLKAIRLQPTNDKDVEFEIKNLQLVTHSELIYVLKQFLHIAYNDFIKGTYPLRIVEKSYARYKKHGRVGMLERLEKEYRILYPKAILKNNRQNIEYELWIEQNESDHDEETLLNGPLISVVIPTYNTPVEYLKKCIDSVLDQSYTNFELCIADDASSDKETLLMLKSYEKYEKVKIIYRKVNGHICKATNSALALASGEYVAFLDHDDMLAQNTLFEVAKVIDKERKIKLIYSDEDKIDAYDRRFEPHFKSGWNPDMFFSHNYISHLSVIRRDCIENVGGLREGYEGAQDYDLLLRVLDGVALEEIVHIEKVLYHWRAISGSTALSSSQKDYTTEAGLRALKDYFEKRDKDVQVEKGLLANTYKVNYPLPVSQPLVSILIPTRDGYDILSKCVQSILDYTTYKNYEIIILDNETTDRQTLDYFEELKKHHQISVLEYHHPFNYSAINNFGVKHAKGDIIGLLNNDVEIISKHWLSEMVRHAVRPDIGAVGAMLYYDNDMIQHAGVVLGIAGLAGHSHKYLRKGANGYFSRLKIVQNYSAVTGACLVVQKNLFLEIKGLNEKDLTIAFNDVDFCLKLQKIGYRNLWTPYVELYHHESISRGAENTQQKRERYESEADYMKQEWKSILENDLYYNKNLSSIYEGFRIDVP